MSTSTEDGNLIEKLLKDIEKNMDPKVAPSKPCIYKVPNSIRSINNDAYTPQVISIGPIHHGKSTFTAMENQKKRYMKSFLDQVSINKLEEIKTFVKENEQIIRNCYADQTFKLQSEQFLMMILYDAIFIIELFLRAFIDGYANNLLLVIPAVRSSLWLDLQLLENQLPYFVLENIYRLAYIGNVPTFKQLSCSFFGVPIFIDMIVLHFTDWRRRAYLKSYPRPTSEDTTKQIEDLPCVVKLHESGVKFKCIERTCLFDVRYEKKKQLIGCFKTLELQIPCLTVEDNTECLLRNVMALEQCLYPNLTHICNYIDLMDNLINSEKDVDLLVEAGIIKNLLGAYNASVANMFNKLCLGIHLSCSSNYYKICTELKAHYENPWNKAMTILKRVYFGNPWRGTGTVAAIILLVLTVIQTICSIMQVI